MPTLIKKLSYKSLKTKWSSGQPMTKAELKQFSKYIAAEIVENRRKNPIILTLTQ